MRTKEEVEKMRDELLNIIIQCRINRNLPGRSEALKSSDSITASIAASQLNALEFVLGNQTSTMIRSTLLKGK
jgi:hypothetical protein